MENNKISVDMISAIPVQFLKPFFEEDFVERGMKANLTKIEWNAQVGSYVLYFDFSEFEEENEKYFIQCYRSNIHTKKLEEETGRNLFTAKEAHMYDSKLKCYFNLKNPSYNRNDIFFEDDIKEYIRIVK